MKRIIRFLPLLVFLCFGTKVVGQVANDACATAQNLGSLPVPQPCNFGPVPTRGEGAPVTYNLTNVNAVPENPYQSMTGCQTGGNMATPASDVWYQITLTGTELQLTINGLTNPNIGLWEGNCGLLTGRGCATGAAGTVSATFGSLNPGTYFLQISGGNVGDTGPFSLTMQNNFDCNVCLTQSNLTVTPSPVNGTCQPNTTYLFCYQITEYVQVSTNWLHGVVPVFGSGWDLNTLAVLPSATCDAGPGQWFWFLGVPTPDGIQDGFFFDGSLGFGGPNGNPVDNFGDDCQGTGVPYLWEFCWQVTTKSCPPGVQNEDLSIEIRNYADGETGAWGSIACQSDPNYFWSASLSCCLPPSHVVVDVSCNNGNDGQVTINPSGTGPYDYLWDDGNGIIRNVTGLGGSDVLSGLSAGTYTITITDQNDNCVTVDTALVKEPVPLVLSLDSTINVTCNGANDGSAFASGSGGTGPYTFAWSSGQTGAVASGLAPGTYSVTLTDANGCEDTLVNAVVITEPPVLVVNITGFVNILCTGGDNGSASAVASGGTPGAGYAYTWSNGQSGPVASNLSSGTYTISVTDSNGCLATNQVTILEPPQLTVSISASSNVSCNGAADGTATATGAGGTPAYTFSWSNGQSGPNATNLGPGTYTVTIRDANNCVDSTTVTITEPPLLTASITASTNVSCNGGNDGTATAAAAGGTPGYTYNWSNGQSGPNATNLVAGTYTVSATDANGCLATAQVTITEPTLLTVSISGSVNVSCNGGNDGSATAAAAGGTPGYTYNWSNGQSGPNANNLTAGTYTVSATDANGCLATTQVTITEPTLLTVSITASGNVSCNGGNDGSATAAGAGGTPAYTYNWSNGQSGPNATNLTAGTYTVSATDANGCLATTQVTITEPTLLTVSITGSTNASCNGVSDGTASAAAAGGTPGYTYNWSNGQSGPNASNLAAGTYTVSATDVNGCLATAQVTITQPVTATVSITASTNVSCNAGNDGTATAAAAGGTPGYTYNWSNGQSGPNATNLVAGTYTVSATDANGCLATAQVTITEPTLLTVSISGSVNVSCNGGNDGSATAAAAGGTPGYTYNWSNGQSGPNASNLTAGTYTVSATDANGCLATTQVTITEPTLLTISITASGDVSCNGGSDGTATAAGAGGTPAYTYNWSNGQSGPNATNLIAGTYSVTVSDANGCLDSTTVTISEPSPLAIGTNTVDATCGAANGSAIANASGGTPGYTYNWSNGQSGPNATSLAAGSYTVVVTDANGCQDSVIVSINNLGSPTIVIDSSFNVNCNGGNDGSAFASASGGTPGYTFNWSNGQNGAAASNLIAGTYTVSVTDANGCLASTQVTITEPPLLTVSISGSVNVSCNGGNDGSATAAAAGGTPAYTYSWSNGQSGPSASGLTVGTYTISVTDANNCLATTTVTITEPPLLTVSIPTSTNVSCNGGTDGTANASAAGGTPAYTYNWSNGQTGPAANNLGAGTYTVTATDANGCLNTASVTITQPSALVANVDSTRDISCNGGNDGIAYGSASGGTGPYTYSWTGGQTGPVASNLSPSFYTLTVTDANGCTATAIAIIGGPLALVANITGSVNVSCNGGNDGTATASGTGGTAPFTFAWSNGQNGPNATGLTAGTYTVSVTDANNCLATNTVTITEPPLLTVSITASNDVNCNGGTNGGATAAAAGGTPAYTYAWSNGQTGPSASNLGAGTYTVSVTDTNGCLATTQVTINEPTALVVTISGSNDPLCNAGNDGDATVNAVGGTPAYSYLWSNGQTIATANSLTAGTYTVTVTDGNGCLDSATVTLGEPTAIAINTNTVDATCGSANGSATAAGAGGTGAFTYAWSDGQSGPAASNLAAGSYTVVVTDINGCSDSSIVSINNLGSPTIVIDSSFNVSCNGGNDGSAFASASGGSPGYTFNWSNGQSGPNATGLTAGTYTVSVTDINNCLATTSITITEPTAVTVGITGSNDVSCNGGNDGDANASASGGTPPFTFVWSNGQSGPAASSLVAGTYTVSATDANGCLATTQVTINEPTVLVVSIAGSTDPLCNGGNDGDATVSASGATPAYSYLWSNGQTLPTATGLSAGTYTVTVTDANGCLDSASVTLGEPTAISINSTTVDATCGAANGSATATGSGGTGAFTYVWSDGQSGPTASNLAAGTYTVVATDANGCSDSLIVNINNLGSPTVTITGSTDASCNAGSDGTATASATGGTPGYTFNWSNGQSGPTATGLAAGTYTVSVTDANTCLATVQVTIGEPTAVVASILSSTDPGCNGGGDGTATASGAGGTPGYTYSWSNGQSGATATGLSATTYSVTVTDLNGCLDSTTVTLGEPTPVAVSSTGSTNISCNGGNDGTASAGATGGTPGYTFLWSDGQTTTTAVGLAAGTYSVTASDINGCQDSIQITLTEPQVLVAAIATSNDPACNGGSDGDATASASGGTPTYNYAWSNGQNGATATGLAAGTYTVTVTDGNGCLDSISVTIGEPTALALSTTSVPATCGNADGSATVTASGATPGYTYLWVNGQTSATATGLASGSYMVTVTDLNGCADSTTATVINLNGPQATIDSTIDVSCFGGADGSAFASATGGNGTLTYTWNNGQTGPVASGLSQGFWWVVVSDSNNCIDSASLVINEPPLLIPSAITAGDVSCFGGSDGIVIASGTGGTPGYSYAWDNGQNTDTANGLAAGTYWVTLTDANGCLDSVSTVVNEPSLLVASVDSSVEVSCNGGNDGIAFGSASGGTPGYSYSWNTNPIQTTAVATGLSANTYVLTVTDSLGCVATDTIVIAEPTAIQLSTTTIPSTCGNADGSATVTATGGTGAFSYSWNDGQTTATASNLVAGPYMVVVTDANGCIDSISVNVVNLGAPTLTLIDSSMISCNGAADGSAEVQVAGGTQPFSYSWNTVPAQTGTQATNLSPGFWTCTITDSSGCTATASVTITEPAVLSLSTSHTDIVCYGDENGTAVVTVTGGTAPYTYFWDNGQTTANASGLADTIYTVIVTDANGCMASDNVTIGGALQVVAGFSSNPSIPGSVSVSDATLEFTNSSTNATIWSWNFGDGGTSTAENPTHTYGNVGFYCVSLIAENAVGCTDTVEACTLEVFRTELHIPNTFTPNMDEKNDVFEILGLDNFPENELTVYNRWGNKVYEAKPYKNDWDGTEMKTGNPLPDGAYFYVFRPRGEGFEDVAGDVVILR